MKKLRHLNKNFRGKPHHHSIRHGKETLGVEGRIEETEGNIIFKENYLGIKPTDNLGHCENISSMDKEGI